jgi:hypothetical protein
MEKRTAAAFAIATLWSSQSSGQVSLTVEQYRAVIPVVSVFVGCKYRARNLRGLIATRNIFCRRKRHQLCGSLAAVPQQLGSRPISIPHARQNLVRGYHSRSRVKPEVTRSSA